MNKSKEIVCVCAVAAAIVFFAPPAHSQITSSSSTVVKEAYPKRTWLKAEVIHADANAIIVREQANERMIHTFTYSPAIKDAMQKIVDAGGYQAGDKVKILYLQGQTVALKIRGKFSKPRTPPRPQPRPA